MLSPEYGLSVLIVVAMVLLVIFTLVIVLVGRFYDWFVNLPADSIDSILGEEKSNPPVEQRTERRWVVFYGVLIILVAAVAVWIVKAG